MRRVFSVIFIMLLVCSCGSITSDTWKEKTADGIAKVATPAVVKALGPCTHSEIIEAKIKSEVMDLEWFKKGLEAEVKGIGATMCELAVGAVLPRLIGYGADEIPAEWGCSASNATDSIVSLAKLACKQID